MSFALCLLCRLAEQSHAEAETLISDKIEKIAILIKSVLTTCLKKFDYVKDKRIHFILVKNMSASMMITFYEIEILTFSK